jgi:hypothetical protein
MAVKVSHVIAVAILFELLIMAKQAVFCTGAQVVK